LPIIEQLSYIGKRKEQEIPTAQRVLEFYPNDARIALATEALH
jgi:hypothetical protein